MYAMSGNMATLGTGHQDMAYLKRRMDPFFPIAVVVVFFCVVFVAAPQFSVPETLCEDNSWYCSRCKELRQVGGSTSTSLVADPHLLSLRMLLCLLAGLLRSRGYHVSSLTAVYVI